jgi:hypothetical protein
MTDSTEASKPLTNSKVGRLIEEHDLTGLGETLERKWLGDDTERRSLRDLAYFFNTELLGAVTARAGMNTLDGEIDNLYRLLTDDEVSSGTRTQARNRLERNGIDVESLERDFVTHQAIHTYLTDFRGVSREESDGRNRETDEQSIIRLKNRTAAVASSIISQRNESGDLSIEDFDVLVDVKIFCRECGSQYTVGELFERGDCDCSK